MFYLVIVKVLLKTTTITIFIDTQTLELKTPNILRFLYSFFKRNLLIIKCKTLLVMRNFKMF